MIGKDLRCRQAAHAGTNYNSGLFRQKRHFYFPKVLFQISPFKRDRCAEFTSLAFSVASAPQNGDRMSNSE
jgi:hypothetical protein